MPLFKLHMTDGLLSNAELIEASKTTLDLEKHLESWLYNSPWALIQEPVLWIGRQTSACCEGERIFPDLLGLDRLGNAIVVELKRGKAPRDVIAQLLEYGAWIHELSEQELRNLSERHFNHKWKSLEDAFIEVMETEDVPPSLNQRHRLFIVAEEIPPSVRRVCRFLRTLYGMDINCIEYKLHQTEAGEILILSDYVVGDEDIASPNNDSSSRWTGGIPVKQVVWEAVQELTSGNPQEIFTAKEVSDVISKKYSAFKRSNVGPELTSDCVNHSSRHHYPGGKDRYWRIEKGKYRLFHPETDLSISSDNKDN